MKSGPLSSTEVQLTRLLVSALEPDEEQRERIGALLAVSNEQQLLDYWARWRLTAVVVERLREVTDLSPAVSSAQEQTLQAGTAAANLQLLVARQLQGGLQREGIDSVLFKGPLLALELHGDIGARGRSTDVDLLVRPEQLHEASRAVQRLGWAAPNDTVDANGFPVMHFHCEALGSVPSVDLHWRAHWYDGGIAYSHGILERGIARDGLRLADPLDQLVVLLTAYARDGFTGLRAPTDVAAWWRRPSAARDNGQLAGRLVDAPQLRTALQISSAICHELVQSPAWPGMSARRRSIRLATRLTTPLYGPRVETFKRAAVDAVVGSDSVAERWPEPYFPRRAYFARPAAAAGRYARDRLLGARR